MPIIGSVVVIDAEQSDAKILKRRDVILELTSETKRNSSVDLRVENVDFIAQPAKHDGERAVLRSYSAVEERPLKFGGYDADFSSRSLFGDLGATQLAP